MAKVPDLELAHPEWDQWIAARQPVVQDLARRLPPDRLYRIKDGHRCTILAYDENGTVRVLVSGRFNFILFDREVFGVDPTTLEECDLPGKDEHLGNLFTEIV